MVGISYTTPLSQRLQRLGRPIETSAANNQQQKSPAYLHPRHPTNIHLAQVLLRRSLRDQAVHLYIYIKQKRHVQARERERQAIEQTTKARKIRREREGAEGGRRNVAVKLGRSFCSAHKAQKAREHGAKNNKYRRIMPFAALQAFTWKKAPKVHRMHLSTTTGLNLRHANV